MGLDVYLHRCDDWNKMIELEEKFNKEVEDKAIAWGSKEYEALSLQLGLIGGSYPTEEIEIISTLHPEHLFKIGYFRSSYNSGGVNSILRTRTGKDLYWVFEKNNDKYRFAPDWEDAAYRISLLINEFNDSIAETGGVQITTVSSYLVNNEITSDNSALRAYMNEKSSQSNPFDERTWYSNKLGHFFGKGITVLAAIEGIGVFDKPATYLIFETDEDAGKDWWIWYRQALEIVRETIDWVLDTGEPDKYGFVWSA